MASQKFEFTPNLSPAPSSPYPGNTTTTQLYTQTQHPGGGWLLTGVCVCVSSAGIRETSEIKQSVSKLTEEVSDDVTETYCPLLSYAYTLVTVHGSAGIFNLFITFKTRFI